MGGFHIIVCILRRIESRFKDTALVRLLSSVRFGRKGTKINTIKGANIGYCVYQHEFSLKQLQEVSCLKL